MINNNIIDIVSGLKELYQTKNPFELCECLGIKVFTHDLGDEIQGFFQRDTEGFEIIHINSRIEERLHKYICAHELGHAVLQPELSLSLYINNPLQLLNKSEIQADQFAAELLLNDSLSKYEELTIEQIASIKNIPVKLVEIKLNRL